MLEVAFGSSGNSQDYTGSGWGDPEPHGRWTVGAESVITISSLDLRRGYSCAMTLGPYVIPPGLTSQQLIILVNRREVLSCRVERAVVVQFEILPEWTFGSPVLEIAIQSPSAVSPRQIGQSQDSRSLGFTVWTMQITPLEAAPLPMASRRPPQLLPNAPSVAVVTMVYNEPEYLPIWLRHYSKHVGAANCYVVDHGSDDGSTQEISPANVVRIPRSPYDSHQQSQFNSLFCNSLLTWYDWVIYCDVDELLLPDPDIAATIPELCRRPLPTPVGAIGLNVMHVEEEENIDLGRPISEQRKYVFGCSPMCKPLLIRSPVTWSPGSHSADAPLRFDHLYMFHLRWFDRSVGVLRQRRTREMQWARTDSGAHARTSDAEFLAVLRGFANRERDNAIDFNPDVEPLKSFLNEVLASQKGRESELYRIALDIWPNRLWRIPARFVGSF